MRGPTPEALLLQANREVQGAFRRGAMREGFDPQRSVYVVVEVRQDVSDLAVKVLQANRDLDDVEATKEIRRGMAEAKRRRTAFVLGGILPTALVAAWFQKRTPEQADKMVERLSTPARPGFAQLLVMADGGRTVHQVVAIGTPGA